MDTSKLFNKIKNLDLFEWLPSCDLAAMMEQENRLVQKVQQNASHFIYAHCIASTLH
jgi:hypothetical protein